MSDLINLTYACQENDRLHGLPAQAAGRLDLKPYRCFNLWVRVTVRDDDSRFPFKPG
jgi:hypothetical protein